MQQEFSCHDPIIGIIADGNTLRKLDDMILALNVST